MGRLVRRPYEISDWKAIPYILKNYTHYTEDPWATKEVYPLNFKERYAV